MNKVIGFNIPAHSGLPLEGTISFEARFLHKPRKEYGDMGPQEKDWATISFNSERDMIDCVNRVRNGGYEIIVYRVTTIKEFCMFELER